MSQQQRANAVMLALLAAVVVKPIEQATGVTLTQDDLLALVLSVPTAWHFVATAVECLVVYIERLQAARRPSADAIVAQVIAQLKASIVPTRPLTPAELAELLEQRQATPVPTQPVTPAKPSTGVSQ